MEPTVPSLVDKSSGLDERETYLLDILFDECGGDFLLAMSKSGYPKNTSVGDVRKKLSKEIKARTKDYIVSSAPKAAHQLVKVFQDPNAMGTKNIIAAAIQILDRGDVNKEEVGVVMPENYIVLLPPKRPIDITLSEDQYKKLKEHVSED